MQSCLVMGNDYHIVMHILGNNYGGNVVFKSGLNFFSENQTQRSQKNVWGQERLEHCKGWDGRFFTKQNQDKQIKRKSECLAMRAQAHIKRHSKP